MDTYKVMNVNPSIVLVQPSQIVNRLDANNYRQDYLQNRETIRKSIYGSKKLGSSLKLPSFRGKGLPINDSGTIPVIKVRNITDVGITGPYDYTDLTNVSTSDRAWVKFGDVLLTVSGLGSSGKADLFWFDKPMLADGHIAILRCTEGLDNGYLKAFLSSPYGKKMSDQDTIGSTGQIELYGDYIDNFDIPYPDPKIQAYIGNKVRLAEKCREEALIRNHQLEQLIDKLCDLSQLKQTISDLSNKPYNSVPIEIIADRFDAEFYRPRYSLLMEHLWKRKEIFLSLREIICSDSLLDGYSWSTENFCQYGVPLIRIREIGKGKLNLNTAIHISEPIAVNHPKATLKPYEIVIGMDGSEFRAAMLHPFDGNVVVNQRVAMIQSQQPKQAALLTFLINHYIGFEQLIRQKTMAAVVGHITKEDILNLTLPWQFDDRDNAAELALQEFELSAWANKLINEAVKDVENLIEHRLDIEAIVNQTTQAPTWDEVYQIIINDKNYA